MSYAMIVYLVGMLDPVKEFFVFLTVCFGILAFVGAVIWLFMWMDDGTETSKTDNVIKYEALGKVWAKLFLYLFFFQSLLTLLIPTKDTAYVMIAATGVEAVVTSDRAKELGGKSLDVFEQWLDELSRDVVPE